MGLLESFKNSSVACIMFAISFFTSGLVINFCQCVLYYGLRPFSKYYYRKINYYLCYSFNCQLVFMAEWWSGSTLILHADKAQVEKYYGKEHGYLVMNHSHEIDWVLGFILCERVRILGNCKTYAKKVVKYVPAIGWGWKFAESIFLERNWDKDKDVIGRQICELADHPDPIWLLMYAEGTRFTPEKHKASQKFAKDKGLPNLNYHLTPRTKGFTASIPALRGKVNAIYDVQMAFKSDAKYKPTMRNLLLGKPIEAHMYINRIPMDQVPEDEEACAKWLHQLYVHKDKLAESFDKTGDFFELSGLPKRDTFQLPRRHYTLINTTFWAFATLIPETYYLVQLFLSGSTIYFSVGVGIVGLFYMLMQKAIGMSEISKSSSYGAQDSQGSKKDK